jgi:small subunit ribosomal protein S1
VVTSLANFGAFVDLGGTDGLVHISELAWHRVRHPREVVRVGDEVDAYVLKLDRANSRIGLSLRRLFPDPWSLVDTKYFIDQRVVGKITNVTDFGAFAHLEDGIEGLIHISELSDAEINHPNQIVKRGEEYLLEIIKIEPERQRIGLSLKRVSPEEQAAWRAEQPTRSSAPAARKSAQAGADTSQASVAAQDEALEVATSETEPEPETLVDDVQGDASLLDGETYSENLAADISSAAGEPQTETLAQEPVA